MDQTWNGAKGIDDYLVLQPDPDIALQGLETQAKDLLEFIEPGHRHEIIRALKLVENEIEREILTKAISKKIGVPVSLLRKEIEPQEADNDNQSGKSVCFEDTKPWPDPVDGSELLEEISSILRRYCILPKFAVETICLWVLLTYVPGIAQVLPLLVFASAEMRCGKTTALSILAKICHLALAASNISPSAIFRSVEKWHPTLIIDEADSFLKDNEELRGILNSGHTRSTAFVIRNVGDDHEPKQFSTWCCKILALIGRLPLTLADRALPIRMFRKKPSEKVDRLSLSSLEAIGQVRSKCLRWAQDNLAVLKTIDPVIPEGLNDRAADNWTPLLAIADLIGGGWPEKSRMAALAISEGTVNEDTFGVMLLQDIKKCFSENNTETILTSDLIPYLSGLEDRPWPEFSRGKSITPRQVARLLQPFGILPRTIRIGPETGKGYKKELFYDAFDRYLPISANSSVTTSHPLGDNGLRDISTSNTEENVTDKNLRKPLGYNTYNVVTDKKGRNGGIDQKTLFSDKTNENVIDVIGVVE